MKRFLTVVTHLLRALRLVPRAAAASIPPGVFGVLTRADQAIVVEYLIASSRTLSLLDGIQDRKRAVDPDEVLTAYIRAEADYVRAGFVPFLPMSVRGAGLTSCEPAAIERSGLVRVADEQSASMATNYAVAIRKQVTRMLARGGVSVLDSSAAERRFQEIIAGGSADRSSAPARRGPFDRF